MRPEELNWDEGTIPVARTRRRLEPEEGAPESVQVWPSVDLKIF